MIERILFGPNYLANVRAVQEDIFWSTDLIDYLFSKNYKDKFAPYIPQVTTLKVMDIVPLSANFYQLTVLGMVTNKICNDFEQCTLPLTVNLGIKINVADTCITMAATEHDASKIVQTTFGYELHVEQNKVFEEDNIELFPHTIGFQDQNLPNFLLSKPFAEQQFWTAQLIEDLRLELQDRVVNAKVDSSLFGHFPPQTKALEITNIQPNCSKNTSTMVHSYIVEVFPCLAMRNNYSGIRPRVSNDPICIIINIPKRLTKKWGGEEGIENFRLLPSTKISDCYPKKFLNPDRQPSRNLKDNSYIQHLAESMKTFLVSQKDESETEEVVGLNTSFSR